MYIKMTELQKSYLMSKENEEEKGTHRYIEFLYSGQIKELEEAFNKVIASQPMLRAKVSDNENFLIEEKMNYKIKVIDSPFDEQPLTELKRKELSHKKYEINDSPFFTMEAIGNNETYRVLFSIDLLIIDDLSLFKLPGQLNMFLSDSALSIYDYSNELQFIQDFYQEKRSNNCFEKSGDYIYPAPQLNYQVENKTDRKFLRKEHSVNPELYAQLKNKADQLSVSVNNLLLTAYSLILSKWSKEEKLSIGVTSFNRPQSEKYYNTIGNFSSKLLLQTGFDFEKSFIENLGDAELSLADALKYEHIEVKDTMPVVFTSMLNSENDDLICDKLSLEYCVSQTPQTYLDFQVKSINGELNISWDYRSDMFEASVIDAMFSEYCFLINEFLNSTEDIVSIYNHRKKYELLSKYENYNVQGSKTNFQFNTLKWHLEKTAKEFPESIFAIINNSKYTFSEVYALATEKAREISKIKKTHHKDKVRIAFNGKKSIHSITCILASILTNDSFCVINEYFGEEKSEETLVSLQNYIYFKDGEFIKVSDSDEPIDKDESYVLHTSGTTGKAKGIIITEEAALNTVYDIIEKFNVTQNDTVMNISNLYFDLSIFDIFGAIITGMSVAFVEIYNHRWFFENNYHHEITIWNSTPALAKEFLLKYRFENLRGVLVSGDFVSKKMVKELFSEYGPIKLFALGGATEASIWSNYYDCSSYENVLSIPYGIPLANQQLYVIDSKGFLCDSRVLGEICIAGDGLAKSYLSEEQTKDAFVWNDKLGEIVYKTGDLGYLGTDNNIYIVGRVTSEIKHNGYRIDLREIEKYINMHEDVSNSVAFIEKLENDRTRLNCAVVCSNSQNIKRKIRSQLSKKLPLYMIPNRITSIPEIPLTGNGKVDIKSLCNMF